MPPTVNLTVIPTGGAVRLDMPGYVQSPGASGNITSMTLSRAVSGATGVSAWTTLYSGEPLPVWVDAGDNMPAPLDGSTPYVWQVADATGTTRIGPVVPAPSLTFEQDGLSQLLIRLLQAGVNNLTLPPGVQPVQVTTSMPVGGWQAMPFITVNQDLIQQTDVGIGQDVPNPDESNAWTIWMNCKRIWRVSILSAAAEERDFYRDSLLAIYQVLLATVFAPIGQNVTHTVQAASGNSVDEQEGKSPGFCFSDVIMELNGVFNTHVITGYGIIEKFSVTVTPTGGSGTVTDTIQVPPA